MQSFSLDKATEILENEGREAQFAYCMQYANGDQKDPDALACLGQFYHNAEGPDRNLEKAEAYYREAALGGSETGRELLFSLGCQYMYVTVSDDGKKITLEEEINFPLDLRKAENILTLCNQFEDARLSCFIAPLFVWLGNYYESGWNGVKQNPNRALKHYKFAADKQDAEGQFCYADLMAYGDCDCNDPESYKYYQLSAGQGYVPAMLRLSRFISHSRHRNLPPILSKWTIALLIGIVFMIPALIMDGIASEYYTQAPQWVEIGMQLTGKIGTIAECYLVIVLIIWSSITKNKLLLTAGISFMMMLSARIIEAFPDIVSLLPYWHSCVFRLMESVGLITLLICVLIFVRTMSMNDDSDYKLAFSWIKKAADTGNPEALYKKASALFYGNGVKKNQKAAIRCYEEAAEKGSTEAKIALGHLYRFGRHVHKDYTRAYQLFREAADAGDCDGQYMVGYCYEHGIGVTYNMEEARTWYRLGRENGSTLADKRLNKPLKPNILDYLMRRTPSYSEAEKERDYAKAENEKLLLKVAYLEKMNTDKDCALVSKDRTIEFLEGQIVARAERIEAGVNQTNQTLTELKADLASAREDLIAQFRLEDARVGENMDLASEALMRKFLEYCNTANAATVEKANSEKNYYADAEARLEEKFGDIWDLLQKDSQISLVSARALYALVKDNSVGSVLDYSGIAISASSALENELAKIFFKGYIDYLRDAEIPFNIWPKSLKDGKGKLKDHFTLGDLPYLLELRYDWNVRQHFAKSDCSEYIKGYLKTIIKDKYYNSYEPNKCFVASKLAGKYHESFISQCEHIRDKYRNPAAHAKTVDENIAKECCEFIMGEYEARRQLNATETVLMLLFELLKNPQ